MNDRFDGNSGYNQGYSDPVYNQPPSNSFGGSQNPMPLPKGDDRNNMGGTLNDRESYQQNREQAPSNRDHNDGYSNRDLGGLNKDYGASVGSRQSQQLLR